MMMMTMAMALLPTRFGGKYDGLCQVHIDPRPRHKNLRPINIRTRLLLLLLLILRMLQIRIYAFNDKEEWGNGQVNRPAGLGFLFCGAIGAPA